MTGFAVYDIMHMILVDRAGGTLHTRSVLKHTQGFTPDIIVAGRHELDVIHTHKCAQVTATHRKGQ